MDRRSEKENKMGVMPVGKLIVTMSWPAILSMMIQATYNVVDSIFVARVSEKALTAVTLIFPAQMLIIAVGVGTAIGVNSLIARRLGARRFVEADKAASHGIRLAVYSWIFFAVAAALFADVFMKGFTHDPYILQNGALYLRIVMIFSLFIFVQMTAEKILQATGSMILPMICSLMGACVNIALDPILIFGLLGAPEMGVTGAAVATVISQTLSFSLGMYILFRKNHQVKVRIYGFPHDKKTIREIYAVGFPAIMMQSILSFLQFGINIILAGFSGTAVAVMGVYGRLQSFIFMPVIGINQGTTPVIGYNYGAGNKTRLMQTYKMALLAAEVHFVCLRTLFMIMPRTLLSFFDAGEGMYAIGIPAMRIISICFLPAAFGIITSGFFQATGHGFISLAASLIRQLVGILPLAIVLSRLWGVTGVWWAFPMAEALGVLFLVIMMRRLYKKEISRLVPIGQKENDRKTD